MTTRRRYTDAQKLAAVAEAEVNGFAQSADRFGIPESNIRYWWDQPRFADLRAKTREDRIDGYRVLIHRSQQRLDEKIDEMEPRDLINLMGVSQDKELLLSGEATARTETRTWTEELDPDSQRRLRDWAFDRLDELNRTGEADGDAEGAGLRESATG
jgi:transposase-like protein